jgi:predicted amidophosphoribosyltransferase
LWTLLVIFIPKAIGFIAYFLLRKPLVINTPQCPKCGTGVGPGFRYCPKCGYAFAPSCPQCGQQISPDYAWCPHCGKGLAPSAPVASPQTS